MKKTALGFAALIAALIAGCSGKPDSAKNENIALETIMTRSSVRSYTDRPVSDDTIKLILKAAMAAPTAVNSQPWTFIVLKDMDMRKELADSLPNAGFKLTASAVNIIVCGDSARMFDREPSYWIQDCSAATENLLLAAHSLGLGAVWCGVFPSEKRVNDLKNIVKLDEKLIPLCIIPIGYPDSEPAIKDKWKEENIIWID